MSAVNRLGNNGSCCYTVRRSHQRRKKHVCSAAAKNMTALRDQYARNIDGSNPDDYWGSFRFSRDQSSQSSQSRQSYQDGYKGGDGASRSGLAEDSTPDQGFCGEGLTMEEWRAFNKHWHQNAQSDHSKSHHSCVSPNYKFVRMRSISKSEIQDALLAGKRALQIARRTLSAKGQGELRRCIQNVVELSKNDVVIFATALGVYDCDDLALAGEYIRVSETKSSDENSWQGARRALLRAFHPDTLMLASPGQRFLGYLVIQHLNQMKRK